MNDQQTHAEYLGYDAHSTGGYATGRYASASRTADPLFGDLPASYEAGDDGQYGNLRTTAPSGTPATQQRPVTTRPTSPSRSSRRAGDTTGQRSPTGRPTASGRDRWSRHDRPVAGHGLDQPVRDSGRGHHAVEPHRATVPGPPLTTRPYARWLRHGYVRLRYLRHDCLDRRRNPRSHRADDRRRLRRRPPPPRHQPVRDRPVHRRRFHGTPGSSGRHGKRGQHGPSAAESPPPRPESGEPHHEGPEAPHDEPPEPTPAPHEPHQQSTARRPSGGRSRRRTPAKRSALLTVAVPSVCVMGVRRHRRRLRRRPRWRRQERGHHPGRGRHRRRQAGPPPTASWTPSSPASAADADDFADRASRTQERIDLKARQAAEKKAAAAGGGAQGALRPEVRAAR